MTEQQLAERFAATWQRCAGSDNGREDAWQQVLTRYCEPHRFYHNMDHLRQCLGELDRTGARVKTPDATEMAIWFHDIVYHYGAKDNEDLSARAFQQAAGEQMPTALVERVMALIIATKHTGEAEDEETAYLVDIDLSGFGLPWDGYLADSNALRLEAPDISDSQYYQGKMRFLNELVSWPHIFQTEFFRDTLEERARANIARYMEQIRHQ